MIKISPFFSVILFIGIKINGMIEDVIFFNIFD